MPHFNVEKGVDMPVIARRGGPSKNQDIIDALFALSEGDSFTMPYSRKSSYESVKSMLQKQNRTNGRQWAGRKEDNVTLRVWRTK